MIAGLLAAATLPACGFAPVYGPGGAGNRLMGRIAVDAPETPVAYLFNRRFEERMGGRGATSPYRLSVRIETDRQELGTTSVGNITRYRLIGRVFYTLRDQTGTVLTEGRTNAFTGYSTTGSTVATLASERDARDRLMTLLADQVIDQLILSAPDFP
ncbi:LPS assembly lipoprotein LptE [Thetidibacter halocola]|nr:LPS assembly lipoprotein LptE [Thetidibacter halocola]